MKTKNKQPWRIFIVVGVLILATALIIANFENIMLGFTFLCMSNVSGLDFYENEKIVSLYQSYDNPSVYFTTENDRVYVFGGYNHSNRPNYDNVEGRKRNEKLGVWEPVLLFEGSVKALVPTYRVGALIITDSNELYRADLNDETFICGNAVDVFESENHLFVIDTNGDLREIENGNSTIITSNVKEVNFCNGQLYILKNSGDLVRVPYSESGISGTEDLLYSNVKSFGVRATNTRYTEEGGYYFDEDAKRTPIINVLTNEGKLYAKGVYSLYEPYYISYSSLPGYVLPASPLHEFSEWELIAEDVDSFSLSERGTIMKLKTGEAAYYGYDTDVVAGTDQIDFAYKQLTDTSVSLVTASVFGISLICTDGTIMAWGDDYVTAFDCDGIFTTNANALSGDPIIIDN